MTVTQELTFKISVTVMIASLGLWVMFPRTPLQRWMEKLMLITCTVTPIVLLWTL